MDSSWQIFPSWESGRFLLLSNANGWLPDNNVGLSLHLNIPNDFLPLLAGYQGIQLPRFIGTYQPELGVCPYSTPSSTRNSSGVTLTFLEGLVKKRERLHLYITATAGTELADAYSPDTVIASSLRKEVHDLWAFYLQAALLYQAFAHCEKFPIAPSCRSVGRVSVQVWLIILSD
ncbi:hypothetical protein Gogos_000679 [Gossypium gossypioides]|uniref:Uncharacterized protein n=1 Tax=Gossypium gossypioides TaxID=34282 RepID=A0A7J9CTU8_GOSGO|nr:hypothetical protein [Gossypium gossypioides]